MSVDLCDPIEIQDAWKRRTIHWRGASSSFCYSMEDEGDFRWDFHYTGYSCAQFRARRLLHCFALLVRQFSVVSSGIGKVSRWTSTRETLTVTDDRDASRLQDASTILFDYLKSLARMCFTLTCYRLRDVHLSVNHTGYFDIVLERFSFSLEIPSLRNIIMHDVYHYSCVFF